MAYIDFTPRQLMKAFGIKFKAKNLFTDIKKIQPSGWLLGALERGRTAGFYNEKSRSERLVSPILLELAEINNYKFNIHSGANLDADEKLGLRGECDFVFSFSEIQDFLTSPIFCITEAKKQDIEQGTIQCAAQLIGAKLFNESEGNTNIQCLYGASTTGTEWRFLKLENNEITIDKDRYYLVNVEQVMGILQHIINVSEKAIQ